MKRLIISGIVFVFMIAFSIVGSFTVTKGADTLTDMVEVAEEYAEADDYESCYREICKIADDWKVRQEMVIPFLAMSRVDEISRSVAELKPLCNKESKSHLQSSLSLLKWLVGDMKDAERISVFLFF